VRSPHVEAEYHLPMLPGTNVAMLTGLAHVIVTEGLVNETFVRERVSRTRSRASRASCRSTAMPVTASSPGATTSGLPSAGHTSGVAFMNWHVNRRSNLTPYHQRKNAAMKTTHKQMLIGAASVGYRRSKLITLSIY
jgi:anaerobic selenocysteine-containing dehydrogenase